MQKQIEECVAAWNRDGAFSGVVAVSGKEGGVYRQAFGLRNRAEGLPNTPDTRFAVASCTKFFTSLCVCRLFDEGLLAPASRIGDVLSGLDLGAINPEVTVAQLLAHTSGIGDYIDEEASGEYFDILRLYKHHPVHEWTSLRYYLPFFNQLPAKFRPGERFGYSNSGYILLGLAVEQAARVEYHEYVRREIIEPLGLGGTGFYRMNRLPGNTALGYVWNEADAVFETNVLYMPIIGGADGGLFTTVDDMQTLWRAVLGGDMLSQEGTAQMLAPHVLRGQEGTLKREYGRGVYLMQDGPRKAYFIMGGDFGVDCFSACFPRTGVIASALGNTEYNTYPLLQELFALLA